MKIPEDPLYFQDRASWRAWLAEHGIQEIGAWLRLKKVHVQEPGLLYDEAVEEALCFGWIDGLMKSLDADFYLLRFSPRTRKSIWSVKNQKRVARLIEEGRMTEFGFAMIRDAQENGEWEAAVQRENVENLPEALRQALAENPLAQENFEKLPASTKKQFLGWIWSAKTDATRSTRVTITVDMVVHNKRLGQS